MTACTGGGSDTCDTTVTVEPVVIRGGGAPATALDLQARATDGGKPVAGLVLEFRVGWPPDSGALAGSADTDAEGVARLHVADYLRATPTQGVDFTKMTRYQAEVSLFQTSEGVGKSVCVRNGQAPFRYEP
ncbi:hypothetical protein [Saccharothrix variisporea]|uniref:Uncharacterized protein n=1 Tax=Saccharothrix variisporea TaxID=543527 RepID=A0A495XP48_9PSEU|nr:hypothetical protein [Saccharothrix variisporea]RKT74975.1 hypothetical protein DFJ66_8350 [Saccharothrix variisporea]